MLYNHLYLGENLERIRNEKSMSIKVLAELIGASESSLRAVESSHRYFSIQRLCKVANRLNVSLDELLTKNTDYDGYLEEPRDKYSSDKNKKISLSEIYEELSNNNDDANFKEISYQYLFSLLYKSFSGDMHEVSKVLGEIDDENYIDMIEKYRNIVKKKLS